MNAAPDMSGDEPVDATVVEEPDPMPTPNTAVAVIDGSAGAIIRADDPREILQKAKAIAAPLKELIESAGLAVALDKRRPDRKHVEVGGWQACGALLGALGGQPLHAETVWTRRVVGEDGNLQRTRYTVTLTRYPQGKGANKPVNVTTYEVDGFDWEACVEIKTPGGIVVGRSEAMVSRAESTWAQRDDYALRSMAETRSESRAWRKAMGWIVHLAGYNPTPAEEMGHTPGADTSPPVTSLPFGPLASDEQTAQLLRAVAYVLDVDADTPAVRATLDKMLAIADGTLPLVAFKAVGALASAVKKEREAAPPPDVPWSGEYEPSSPDSQEAKSTAELAEMLRTDDDLASARKEADRMMRYLRRGPEKRLAAIVTAEKTGEEGLVALISRLSVAVAKAEQATTASDAGGTL